AQAASRAFTDANLRRELASAGITRSELLLQTIRMIQVFLAQSPRNPMADEASLALVGAFTELEDFPAVVKLAARFARLYPKSSYLDSFQYSEALANFHLGQYDRAIEVAETIARATYKDPAGAEQPSPNKWQALYILGQIYDARRQPGKALNDYRNTAQVEVKVYPVDLMQLYLTRRNLNGIAGIDLAGITPLVEKTVPLGDGADYDDKVKSIDLPLTKEGAYLVMIRGENLYAS